MTKRSEKTRKRKAGLKRRPRAHIIEAISFHWLALMIVRLGHVIDTPAKDYGTDCTVSTFEPQTGLLEPDFFKVQLKASDLVKHVDGAVSFPADMRDLRDWERSSLITFLVVFDAKEERGWWLNIQDYIETSGLDPHTNDNATHVLHLPHTNEVSESAIAAWRDMKNTRNEQVRRLL